MTALQGTVLITVLTALVTGSDDFRSDYKYHSSAQGWFKLHTVPAKWENARLRCTLEGAILASPINEDISDVMTTMVRKNDYLSTIGLHTGVHNKLTPTEFTSLEGVPLTKMPVKWANIFSEEYNAQPSCLHLSQDDLVARSCNDARPYLCYKKKTADLDITECGTVDRGYQRDNRTGHCYKFHNYAMTWPEAYLACLAEGAYLVVINSAEENTIIKDLYGQYPDDKIFGPNKVGIHIGFYGWNELGVYRTIHGESLEDAGFAQWSPGQPDNVYRNGKGEQCGAMYRSGLLDDIWCDFTYAFVCEKDPTSLRPVQNQCL